MSSASSTASTSPNYLHQSTSGRISSKRSKLNSKSTIIGKTPYQVERRNARERRRVQAVNQGYEDLAKQISDWDELKNKKLTKAETLKAAIMYIQHLEDLLSSPHPLSASNSPPSANNSVHSALLIKNEQLVSTSQAIKTEPMAGDNQSQCHQSSRQFHPISAPTQPNYLPSVYTPYFNTLVPSESSLSCQSEYGNENHLFMHYDFNSGQYS